MHGEAGAELSSPMDTVPEVQGCQRGSQFQGTAQRRLFQSSCPLQEVEVYAKTLASVREVEQSFAALWTQCQRHQGSPQQDVPYASNRVLAGNT